MKNADHAHQQLLLAHRRAAAAAVPPPPHVAPAFVPGELRRESPQSKYLAALQTHLHEDNFDITTVKRLKAWSPFIPMATAEQDLTIGGGNQVLSPATRAMLNSTLSFPHQPASLPTALPPAPTPVENQDNHAAAVRELHDLAEVLVHWASDWPPDVYIANWDHTLRRDSDRMDWCEQHVRRHLRRWSMRILFAASSGDDLRRRARNMCRQARYDSDANRRGRANYMARTPR
eukprot:9489777-Pyramimonas_sp.AAC.1